MKRLIIFMMLICSTMGAIAQQDIKVDIIDGISNNAIKERMEYSVSMLWNNL